MRGALRLGSQVAAIAFLSTFAMPSIDQHYSTPVLTLAILVCILMLLPLREMYLRDDAEAAVHLPPPMPNYNALFHPEQATNSEVGGGRSGGRPS